MASTVAGSARWWHRVRQPGHLRVSHIMYNSTVVFSRDGPHERISFSGVDSMFCCFVLEQCLAWIGREMGIMRTGLSIR